MPLSKLHLLVLSAFTIFVLNATNAQDKLSVAKAFLQEKATEFGLSKKQASEPILSSYHVSKNTGLSNFYFQQHIDGIPVNRAILNVHITKDDKILKYGNTFVREIEKHITSSKPAKSSLDALEAVFRHLGYAASKPLTLKERKQGPTLEVLYDKGEISMVDIPVKLVYQPLEDGSVRLAWDVEIEEPNGQNYWSIRVDASTGEILEKNNLVIQCNFGDSPHFHRSGESASHAEQMMEALPPAVGGGSYRVFKEPIESPSHGSRTLVSDPADATASPFGWHDTNGAAGAEFTITRGNNVHAYLDRNNDGVPDAGSEPDGGASLIFDNPLNLNLNPNSYQDAAVTNLFYWNNLIHDFAYKYGFDEQSGNFQINNYGKGGLDADDVRAEAQDGGGINNANFFTPVDGSRPRMQMYLWARDTITINSPAAIAGSFTGGLANFGPQIFDVTGDVVYVLDFLIPQNDGCDGIANDVNNKIALMERSVACNAAEQAIEAQVAGAKAAIICNDMNTNFFMTGLDPSITIPVLSISSSRCQAIKDQLPGVNLRMVRSKTLDGDFDNGVIAHEYGHGISTRLTGGPAVNNCLNNDEQMGEGWSDWYALMMTLEPGDDGADVRGIGTYALDQPTNGNGIRPTPYSTDMSVNPSTYNTIKTSAIPHGVGYVWATVLWDLTWGLIEDHGLAAGFDLAMWLVNDGMKLQPCSPGFVDGRDAILLADMNMTGGANQCRIWQVFARRGLGRFALQGLTSSVVDGAEDFSMPPMFDDDSDFFFSCIDDCDDNDHTVYPGAPEICDGKDNDCNGLVDDGINIVVPTGITSTVLTATSVKIDWNDVPDADRYQVRYRIQGTNSWTTSANVFVSQHTLAGLSANHVYQYQVRARCTNAINGNWSATFTFFTSTCGIPTGVAVSNITTNSVMVSWNPVGGVISYLIRYRKPGFSWTTTSSAMTSKTLTGLLANTAYEVQVASFCAGGAGAWSTSTNFTTASSKGSGILASGSNLPGTIDWKLFPNPARSGQSLILQLAVDQMETSVISIYDLQGRAVYQQPWPFEPGFNQVNLDDLKLNTGLYLVTIRLSDQVLSKRWVVQE